MNENTLPEAAALQPPERGATTAGDRFGGFAMAHLALSVLMVSFAPFELAILDVLPEWTWSFVSVLMMGFYFPLGILTAWMGNWTLPQTTKEGFMAVISPTVVAWIWVGIVLWSVSLDGDSAMSALPIIFFLSIIFATPSSVFVIFCWWDSFTQLLWCGLLAGLLPPLLFALGSFWQGSRQARKLTPQIQEMNGISENSKKEADQDG